MMGACRGLKNNAGDADVNPLIPLPRTASKSNRLPSSPPLLSFMQASTSVVDDGWYLIVANASIASL